MHDKRLGQVTAQQAYDCIAHYHCQDSPEKTLVNMWKYNLTLKVICFVWLYLPNRINTWDNLLKKGWTSSNRCCLCRSDAKLFVDCRFTKEVIVGLSSILHQAINWNEPTYLLNVVKWTRTERELRYLPLLMTWHLWLLRNIVLFEYL